MNEHDLWDENQAQLCIDRLASTPGALLPILHALQEQFGYVDEAAVPLIARSLNLSQAEVHGTITFYHDFRRSLPGRHILRICRAEACQAMGCEQLISHVEKQLGVTFGQTTKDRTFTVEQVFCLGLCAMSPSVMLDEKPYGRVNTQTIDSLIDSARRLI
jgi:formate dehydrogenase subunit gamma